MTSVLKRSFCAFLCLVITFCFASCSGNAELTDENVTSTVEKATAALQEFDTKNLEKYVDSSTLDYILKLANGHDQFAKLGVAIFENLTIEIKSINLDEKTVTVSVKNKNLYMVASNFTYDLTSNYSTFQLLSKLSDDNFLDTSLSTLTDNISAASMNDEEKEVKLTITQAKRNLVLGFDEDAEDAVSGGALTAIKQIIGV